MLEEIVVRVEVCDIQLFGTCKQERNRTPTWKPRAQFRPLTFRQCEKSSKRSARFSVPLPEVVKPTGVRQAKSQKVPASGSYHFCTQAVQLRTIGVGLAVGVAVAVGVGDIVGVPVGEAVNEAATPPATEVGALIRGGVQARATARHAAVSAASRRRGLRLLSILFLDVNIRSRDGASSGTTKRSSKTRSVTDGGQ
jgi:hypothetical protein